MAPEDPQAGGPAQPDPPRIHVDSDWKRQAQAEKERLSRQVEQKGGGASAGPAPGAAAAPQAAAGAGPQAGGGPPRGGQTLPPASFAALVQTLGTQAAIFMSDQRDPETGLSVRNLDLAKHNIDMLRVLEEKTRGNLTEDERRLLETVLYELLMAYVEAAG